MPKFFLNYGGPGGYYYSENPEQINRLDKACSREYTGWDGRVSSIVKGINVTVLSYGVHRALLCEIPDDNVPRAVKAAFNQASYTAQSFRADEYSLLGHNCVTAVATVLHELDEHITPPNVVVPWSLDSKLNDYCGSYEGTVAKFAAQYQRNMKGERLSMFRIRTWSEDKINSVNDLIEHSYGKREGSGERTKSTLLDLGWVTSDRKGILTPTFGAPVDFREGLIKYNEDFAAVERLKKLYKQEASFVSGNTSRFFGDSPNYETAMQRLRDQAVRNPDGASAKVLSIIRAEVTTDYRHLLRRGREELPTPALAVEPTKPLDDRAESDSQMSI